jgi:hypothetical protein
MMDAALGLPDGNDVDQPMGPIVVNGPLLDVHGYPMTPVEVKEGKGKGKYKDNDNQGMGMPEASDEYDMEDEDDMDDIGGKGKGKDKLHNRTGQSVGDFLEGNLSRQGGKGSQGPDEVAGKGNDKCNYSWDPQDDDIFAGLLKGDGTYWEGECAADVANKRARRLWAYCERTGTDDKCECTDIEKRKMFNEKARFPRKWKPVRCHWCHKDLPAEFLDDVVLVPLLMTHTQVPIVLEVDAVEKVLQTEGLRVEREMTQTAFKNMVQSWKEDLDKHGHNHSSKLTWFGEKLDATINQFGEKLDATIKTTRDTEVECQRKISQVNNNVLKLEADMNDLKGNQDVLMAQGSSLGNMLARRDDLAQQEMDTMMGMMNARFGELEHLIQRIDQRRRDEAHDEALAREGSRILGTLDPEI